MRVTYLHQYFNTPQMPGSVRSYEFARRLVDVGHTVNLITTTREVSEASGWYATDEDGIRVHWYPVAYSNQMSFTQRIRAFGEFAAVSSRLASQLPTDVVFATSTPLTIGIPGIIASKIRRVPLVFEVRDLWPDVPISMGLLKNPIARRLAIMLEQLSYRNSSSIVALSPDMKAGIVRKGIPPEDVTVIPNASDMEVFDVPQSCGDAFRSRHEWLGGRPLVVYTGTFGRVNGVEYLVDLAYEILAVRPDVRFLLVGEGAELEAVRSHAHERGVLDKSVFFMPPIQKHEVATLLSAATVCCSTVVDNEALWANSANKVFDALAAGRPVLINHGGWQKVFLEEAGAGVELPASDMRRAARELVDLLDDEERLHKMRHAAKSLALNRFSRDKLAEELRNVLVKACDGCTKSEVS